MIGYPQQQIAPGRTRSYNYIPSTLFGRSILTLIRRKLLASYDPFYGGWPEPCGHWQSAYVREIRERSCGDVYVVEMSVSLLNFCFLRYRKIIHDYGSPYPAAGERDGKIT